MSILQAFASRVVFLLNCSCPLFGSYSLVLDLADVLCDDDMELGSKLTS